MTHAIHKTLEGEDLTIRVGHLRDHTLAAPMLLLVRILEQGEEPASRSPLLLLAVDAEHLELLEPQQGGSGFTIMTGHVMHRPRVLLPSPHSISRQTIAEPNLFVLASSSVGYSLFCME